MNRLLKVSLIAMLVVAPFAANATLPATYATDDDANNAASAPTLTATQDVASTSYVKGAYNSAIGYINELNTAVGGKQAQLTNGTNNVGATVATSVRASGTADDVTLVTEKAVRDAITNAGGQTAQDVEDAIDAAAGDGLATNGSGVLSVDVDNSTIEVDGTVTAAEKRTAGNPFTVAEAKAYIDLAPPLEL